MECVARSATVLDYLRRVKTVVTGSSIMWFQCTGLFALGAVLERPLSPTVWIIMHAGMDLASAGSGFLYYMVIGEWGFVRTKAVRKIEI